MVQRGIAFIVLLAALLAQTAPGQSRDSTGDSLRWMPRRMTDDDPRKILLQHRGFDTSGYWRLRSGGERVLIDTLQTLTEFVYANMPRLAPAGYVRQNRIRNAYQRAAYEDMMFDLAGGDGLAAWLHYLKSKLEIALSMEHHFFAVLGIPLPNDWSFPKNPYKEVWWRK